MKTAHANHETILLAQSFGVAKIEEKKRVLLTAIFLKIRSSGYGGICSETDYPYTSGDTQVDGTCSDSACNIVSGSAPAAYVDVDTNTDALESAVTQQPVSVAIQTNQPTFQSYNGGVLTGRCGTRLDHGAPLLFLFLFLLLHLYF